MSSVESTTTPASSTRGGRPSATTRGGGRGRGRGRGGFRFPQPPSTDVEGTRAPGFSADVDSQPSQSANADQPRRKPPRKANARRSFTSVSSSGPIVDTESVPKQSLEKELPPHIAGAAVDAESLVSRVRELAIHAHAHSSSVESRFTMSRNWADEEDDPDSLPDLDDWALKPKSRDANIPQQEFTTVPPETQLNDMKPVEDAPSNKDSMANLQSRDGTNHNPDPLDTDSADGIITEKSSAVAPIFDKADEKPAQAETSGLPPPEDKRLPKDPSGRGGSRSKNTRQANNRGRTSRIADLPFHPLNLSRSSQAKDVGSQPSTESRKPEDKQNSRKPHSRPVISSDALARISRSLGRAAVQPPAATT